MVALLYLSSWCSVMWLFLTMPWVDLLCMIVVLTELIHLLFEKDFDFKHNQIAEIGVT